MPLRTVVLVLFADKTSGLHKILYCVRGPETGRSPARSGGSMPLFPAIFFATLIAAIVYVAGRHLVFDDQE
jgi:hypothetical protein